MTCVQKICPNFRGVFLKKTCYFVDTPPHTHRVNLQYRMKILSVQGYAQPFMCRCTSNYNFRTAKNHYYLGSLAKFHHICPRGQSVSHTQNWELKWKIYGFPVFWPWHEKGGGDSSATFDPSFITSTNFPPWWRVRRGRDHDRKIRERAHFLWIGR